MNIFVANIGNRDIAFNCGTEEDPDFVTFSKQRSQGASKVQEVLECEPGTRAMVSALSEAFSDRQTLLGHLRFPILRPALKQALADCGQDGKLDRIILIGTDQDPDKAPRHYPWDTITTVGLLRDLLPLDSDLGLHPDTSIEVFPVRSQPHRFESAYRHLEGVFDIFTGADAHIYASVNGGIPALNTALRIRALNSFGPRAHLIETEEPSDKQKKLGAEGDSTLADSWPYRRDALLRIARDLLDTYEYDALLDVLDRELSEEEKNRFRGAQALLRHAAARFNLDFENAAEILQQGVHNGVLPDDIAKPYAETANRGPLSLQRLHEILGTIRILLDRGDYSNLVIRTAILIEAVQRQLFSLLTDTPKSSDIRPADLDNQLVKTLRQNNRVHRDDRDGTYHINTPFLLTGINWAMNQLPSGAAKEAAEKAQSRLRNQLSKMRELRHDVIHRAEGTSQEDLERHFTKAKGLITTLEGLLGEMKTLHKELNGSPQVKTDVFAELNADVLGQLSVDQTST
jgi:hypothetical protein